MGVFKWFNCVPNTCHLPFTSSNLKHLAIATLISTIMPGISEIQPAMQTSSGIFNVCKPFKAYDIDSEIAVTLLKLFDKNVRKTLAKNLIFHTL